MRETPGRLLRLLSLLQMPRDWSGTELASRLNVTTRTVRRDVDRLRELGYPVHAEMGPVGGYRLGAGSELPPLLLDDDEAVAVTIALHTSGLGEASQRALGKLSRVLPSRLRNRVAALEASMLALPVRGPVAEPAVLTAVSAAIRDASTLRFDYVDHFGESSRRSVEPHRLVSWGRRWYVVGWDTDRSAWRTFRADRVSPRTPNGPKFTHRDPPDGDLTAYLTRTMGREMWPLRAVLRVFAPASELAGRVEGEVSPIDERTCRLELASDSYDVVAFVVGMLDVAFEVESPPELAERLRVLSARYAEAAGTC
ncbi:helix-turn-helix transcriptional regulator [Amycolatopsis sp. RTGN1]|uniref:helix-turn-helix transcriptional regulator n=1 Tax=Amycolatopsis ponsaeliensis TaxID=2992142 RepID=UPI002550C203|nr:WYL domain-containing protein [Amycolatopsis sp. RTGN1]